MDYDDDFPVYNSSENTSTSLRMNKKPIISQDSNDNEDFVEKNFKILK